ncbi:hypothetical protein ACH5RR_012528 [Cinchona calisaya]|uniref:Uncharacterized protein n=1 Tax=Cinchona calisaya TaxID=153742 RepID=A0ABD3AAM1_9GENT
MDLNLHLLEEIPSEAVTLIVAVFFDKESWSWRLDKLKSLLPKNIVDKVLSVPIPLTEQEDTMLWSPNSSGELSIKNVYNTLRDEEFSQTGPHPLWMNI